MKDAGSTPNNISNQEALRPCSPPVKLICKNIAVTKEKARNSPLKARFQDAKPT
jgi:hypothetical protein